MHGLAIACALIVAAHVPWLLLAHAFLAWWASIDWAVALHVVDRIITVLAATYVVIYAVFWTNGVFDIIRGSDKIARHLEDALTGHDKDEE